MFHLIHKCWIVAKVKCRTSQTSVLFFWLCLSQGPLLEEQGQSLELRQLPCAPLSRDLRARRRVQGVLRGQPEHVHSVRLHAHDWPELLGSDEAVQGRGEVVVWRHGVYCQDQASQESFLDGGLPALLKILDVIWFLSSLILLFMFFILLCFARRDKGVLWMAKCASLEIPSNLFSSAFKMCSILKGFKGFVTLMVLLQARSVLFCFWFVFVFRDNLWTT